jgi:geranylgeranyl reductase
VKLGQPLTCPAGNPLDDVKLLVNTVASIVRANALRAADSKSVDVNFGSKATEEFQARATA